MNLFKGKIKEEEGSATIEFLGILPLALLLLVIIWQFIVAINGVLIAQSAANEYATVYSVTKDHIEARSAAVNILDTADNYLQNISINGPAPGVKEFAAEVNVSIQLIFLPEEVFGNPLPTIPYSTTTYGRVIE